MNYSTVILINRDSHGGTSIKSIQAKYLKHHNIIIKNGVLKKIIITLLGCM